MKDEDKTKEQLIAELAEVRSSLADMEEQEYRHRQAEEELQKSEAAHRSLIEQLPSGTWLYKAALDEIASTIYVSPQIEGLGFTQQEWMAGHDLWSRQLHPDDRERVLTAFRLSRTHSDPFVCEYRMYARDNSVRWYRDHAAVVRDSNGTPLFYQGLMADITDRKQAEDVLRESEERFSQFMRFLPGPAFIKDEESRYVYLSDQFESLFDIRLSDWLGKSPEEIWPADIAQQLREDDELVLQKGLPVQFEEEVQQKGERRRYLTYKFPINRPGKPLLLGGVGVDITERKQIQDFQLFLAQCGSATPGEDFFRSIAKYLAQKLGTDFVCIDRLEKGSLAATTVAVYFDGKFEDNITYALKDTPCGDVVKKKICCFPSGVSQLFPQDKVLQEMKAESYVGTTLWGHRGQPIGLIALIWRKPLANPELVKSLLQLVGGRAAGELERKLAEEELRRSEERYRSLAEAAHDMIFIIDREGYIEYVNRFAAQQFGLKPEELIGRRRAEMFQAPESERQQSDLNRIFESGEPFYREDESPTRFPAGDKWLGTWLVPLRNDDGSVRAVLGISRDITERRVIEDQLRESKLMLQSVLDTIPVRVFWKDLNSVFLGCNRPFALDAGLSDPGELLGKDDYAMGWREQADLYRGDDRLVMESGIPKLNFEEPQTTPDGKQIILKTSKIPLRDSRGRIRGVLGTYEDITERKQAEVELRMLSTAIEQSPASVVITDADGNIEYVNPKFTRLTGYTFEEAIGKNPRILKSDVLPQEEYERLWQAIISGNVWRGEFCNKKKNGDLYWESAVISPVKDTKGVITHFLAVKEDITELKKSEDEKKGLEAQLRHAQKLETIGTLAGGIAHDFNNILQPVNSCAELIRSRIPTDSPLVKYVDLISRAVERGSGLVKQLLTFSRQREHERSPLRLQPVVSETLSLLRAVIPTTVEIHDQIDPACSPVLADPVQIQQVVMNLCTNACDAMGRNGVLTVRLTEVDVDEAAARSNLRLQPGRYVQITVQDTGHGIDEETQKRIFDPFFTTKEVGKGTGLGLSVVHGIVLEHGGDIVVESDQGSGTTFRVYLPCSGEVAEKEFERGEEMTQGGKGSILFVDDNEDIVFIANEMLEHLGYSMTAMTSNAEALEKFRQNPGGYDLVISDYSMPGMNGVQLAWELLNVRPDIPVLLITGNNEAIPAERLKEVPVRGVISKPFTMGEIGDTIRQVLDQG